MAGLGTNIFEDISVGAGVGGAMSLEEFLEWEERQELPYEFDGVQPEAMVGGTLAHAAIQANLVGRWGTGCGGRRAGCLGDV